MGASYKARFKLRGFKRPREAFALFALGKLERAVMNEAWRCGQGSVREICAAFGERFAYTTVMTTLDRLHKKGLLDRRKEGRAFVYAPRVSPQQLEEGIALDVIDDLFGRSAEAAPVLACIVEAISERDGELLDELDRLVREKKRELEQES